MQHIGKSVDEVAAGKRKGRRKHPHGFWFAYSPEECDRLRAAAEAARMTASDFVRQAIDRARVYYENPPEPSPRKE